VGEPVDKARQKSVGKAGNKALEKRHVGNPAFHPPLAPSLHTAKAGLFRRLVPRAIACHAWVARPYPQKDARPMHNHKNHLFSKNDLLYSFVEPRLAGN
jgi:hypothetical protein